MKQKILVVDDEQSIVTLLKYNLEKSGFDVTTVMNGVEAFEVAKQEAFDLIILDLMLPELDGIEICKQLRQNKVTTPIIMLTAKDDEFDKVLGLELGADDYMTKPFSTREVVARIRAVIRRIAQNSEYEDNSISEANEIIKVGDLKVYPDNYEAFFKEKQLELTPKEFELLAYLAKHKGRVITRDQLLSFVWNFDFTDDTRIVDVHISHLREKVEPNPKKPIYIKTVRGMGYKLETRVTM